PISSRDVTSISTPYSPSCTWRVAIASRRTGPAICRACTNAKISASTTPSATAHTMVRRSALKAASSDSRERSATNPPRTSPEGDVHRAPHVVEPGAAGLLAAQGIRDQRRDREIDVVLLAVIGPGDQDPVAVSDQHPRRAHQPTNIVRLIQGVGAGAFIQQPL